ncbi:MAG: hypothetical protein ACRDK3_06405 [Actinomycetota bacterium]
MNAGALTRGEALAGVAGIALIIISVIPYWGSAGLDLGRAEEPLGFEPQGLGTDWFSLWESGVFGILPKLAVLIGLLTVVMVLVRATGAAPTPPAVTYLALGVAATLLLLMAVAVGPSVEDLGFAELRVEMTRGPLLYAGLVLCALMLFGGWLHLQSEDSNDFGNRTAAPPPM